MVSSTKMMRLAVYISLFNAIISIALGDDCGQPNDPEFDEYGEITPHAYPWAVFLDASYENTQMGTVTIYCTGSLLSDEWVVTAAHCVNATYNFLFHQWNLAGVNVFLGDHDLTIEEDGEITMNVPAANVIRHDDYSHYTLDYDIALIKLPNAIEYTDNIKPVCLPELEATLPNGSSVMNVGWGLEGINVLQQGEEDVIDNEECDGYFASYSLNITDRMMCTLYEDDQCIHASGGPVMWKNGAGRYVLQGIISFIAMDMVGSCVPDMPVVHVNVANFVDWVTEQTGL